MSSSNRHTSVSMGSQTTSLEPTAYVRPSSRRLCAGIGKRSLRLRPGIVQAPR